MGVAQNNKSPRTRHYALLNIGKKQLGWDDDFYRDTFLKKHGAKEVKGRISATTMSLGQLMQAYQDMRKCGFKPKKKRDDNWRAARIELITRLWGNLKQAGLIRNPDPASMVKWCGTITHKAKLEWATSPDLNKCVEGLKSWCKREGVPT